MAACTWPDLAPWQRAPRPLPAAALPAVQLDIAPVDSSAHFALSGERSSRLVIVSPPRGSHREDALSLPVDIREPITIQYATGRTRRKATTNNSLSASDVARRQLTGYTISCCSSRSSSLQNCRSG